MACRARCRPPNTSWHATAGCCWSAKQTSIALHYRLAPTLETLCVDTLARAIAQEPGLQLLRGKAVVEVKSAGVNKGTAIEAFMQEAPFKGRVPIFAGDDVTDEAGFDVVLAPGRRRHQGGRWRHARPATAAPTPQALREWLGNALHLSSSPT